MGEIRTMKETDFETIIKAGFDVSKDELTKFKDIYEGLVQIVDKKIVNFCFHKDERCIKSWGSFDDFLDFIEDQGQLT